MAVAGKSWDEPNMCMGHRFTEYDAHYPFGSKCFSLRVGDLAGNFVVFSDVWNIPDPAEVFFRNDKDMAFVDGMNVKKCLKIFILIYSVTRHIACRYFAKNAVFHVKKYIPRGLYVNLT